MGSDKMHTALLLAIRKGDLNCAQRILKSYNLLIDEQWLDYSLLLTALHKNRPRIVNLLIDNGCRVRKPEQTKFFNTPLYSAVGLGHLGLVEKLLDSGASIRQKDRNTQTPLNLAVRREKFQII